MIEHVLTLMIGLHKLNLHIGGQLKLVVIYPSYEDINDWFVHNSKSYSYFAALTMK